MVAGGVLPLPGVGPVPSYPPVHHGSGAAGGQGYPPSRYSTPTLNQLLQPGTGVPVQRYSYGDYPQQQPPPSNSHPAAGWPMQQQQSQQPRNFAPGFKPPPNSMQQVQDNVKVKLISQEKLSLLEDCCARCVAQPFDL
jgi:hypothetical protein